MKLKKKMFAALFVMPVALITLPSQADYVENVGETLDVIKEEMSDYSKNQQPRYQVPPPNGYPMQGQMMRSMDRGNMGYMRRRGGPDDRMTVPSNLQRLSGGCNSGHKVERMQDRNMREMRRNEMGYMPRKEMRNRRQMEMGNMHDMRDMPMMQMMQQRHAAMQEHMTTLEDTLGNIEALLQQLVDQQKMD